MFLFTDGMMDGMGRGLLFLGFHFVRLDVASGFDFFFPATSLNLLVGFLPFAYFLVANSLHVVLFEANAFTVYS